MNALLVFKFSSSLGISTKLSDLDYTHESKLSLRSYG
jgi:hypothetical protein